MDPIRRHAHPRLALLIHDGNEDLGWQTVASPALEAWTVEKVVLRVIGKGVRREGGVGRWLGGGGGVRGVLVVVMRSSKVRGGEGSWADGGATVDELGEYREVGRPDKG